jgi:hypothetical protein
MYPPSVHFFVRLKYKFFDGGGLKQHFTNIESIATTMKTTE